MEGATNRVQSRRRRVFALRAGGVALAAGVATVVAVMWLFGAFKPGPVKPGPAAPGPTIAKLPAPPPVIWTAAARTVQHTIGPHQVTLSADTRVKVISKAPESTRLELLGGEARFAVKPLQLRSSFAVLTPQVKVIVVGTRFNVDSDELCSRVDVQAGQVRAISIPAQKEYLLGPGMSRTFCSESHLAGSQDADERQVGQALSLVAAHRDLDRAAELLERYLQRQPRGSLAEESLYYLVFVRHLQGKKQLARTLADRFTARFRDTPRAARIHRWLSENNDQ